MYSGGADGDICRLILILARMHVYICARCLSTDMVICQCIDRYSNSLSILRFTGVYDDTKGNSVLEMSAR